MTAHKMYEDLNYAFFFLNITILKHTLYSTIDFFISETIRNPLIAVPVTACQAPFYTQGQS